MKYRIKTKKELLNDGWCEVEQGLACALEWATITPYMEQYLGTIQEFEISMHPEYYTIVLSIVGDRYGHIWPRLALVDPDAAPKPHDGPCDCDIYLLMREGCRRGVAT